MKSDRLLTSVARDVAPPEDLHDLPVSHGHEDQRAGVEEDYPGDGDGDLDILAPGHVAPREQDRHHLCGGRERLQHHQVRYVCGNGECCCTRSLIISRWPGMGDRAALISKRVATRRSVNAGLRRATPASREKDYQRVEPSPRSG